MKSSAYHEPRLTAASSPVDSRKRRASRVDEATTRAQTTAPAQSVEVPKRRPGRPKLDTPSDAYLARQAEIISAAAEVCHANGYGFGAGILEDIAAALGLHKATLYYYIRSKAHLLYLLMDRGLSIGLERLEQLSDLGSGEEIIKALIRHQVTVVAEDPALFTVYFDHRHALSAEYEVAVQAKERRYFRLFTTLIDGACADGTLRGVDPMYAARALIGMTTWTYKWYDPSSGDDLDAFIATAVNIVLCGGAGKSRT